MRPRLVPKRRKIRATLPLTLQDQFSRRGRNASSSVGPHQEHFRCLDSMVERANRIFVTGLDDCPYPVQATTEPSCRLRHPAHQFSHAAPQPVSDLLQGRDLRIALPRLESIDGILCEARRICERLL